MMKYLSYPVSSLVFLCLCMLTGCGCHQKSCVLEPDISYFPPQRFVEKLPSSFDDLSPDENQEDWGKEVKIATAFARELDLYRAITGFKRALILIPRDRHQRRLQIEYDIMLCYYLGGKYREVAEVFEVSDLRVVASTFPGVCNLLIMLYDSYLKIGCEDKAEAIFKLIEKYSPDTAFELTLSTALEDGDVEGVEELIEDKPSYCIVNDFIEDYHFQAKSVRKAQLLNAVLPGSGYLYVGQSKSALTSFLINALFTAAAYQFFHHGYVAAGLITASLETGWYLGGINGAGLAAKEYNEHLYEETGKETMIKARLFPVLMFEVVF